MSNNVINPYQTFRDSTGAVRASGTVTFYVNGTTTLATIYSDEALTVTQTNPYTLDAFGRIVGDVKYQGLMTIKEANSDGSDPITTDNVATLETANQLRTDLADTATATNGDALVGVKKTDSNAQATTQHILNENRVYDVIADYGATGDGATDDRTAIQNAINDCSSAGGGVVWFPAATYIIGSALTMKTKVTLMGEGVRSIIKLGAAANDSMILWEIGAATMEDTNIVDIALDGNESNQTTSGNYGAVKAWNAKRVRIENVFCHDQYAGGIGFSYDTTGQNYCTEVKMINCVVDNTGTMPVPTAGSTSGIIVTAGQDILIQGNTVKNVQILGGIHLETNSGAGQVCKDIIIDNNHIVDCLGDGITLKNNDTKTSDRAGVSITNNTIRDCGSEGIFCNTTHYFADSHAMNNRIYGCAGGIELYKDANIIGNAIYDSTATAIIAQNGSIVKGNHIRNCTGSYGIEGFMVGTIIQGNYIEDQTGIGIFMQNDASPEAIISDNMIFGDGVNMTYGIQEEIGGAAQASIYNYKNNMITGWATAPVLIRSKTAVTDTQMKSLGSVDLSGGAQRSHIFTAERDYWLVNAQYIYTEASSADAGVTIGIGKAGADTHFHSMTSEAGQVIWYNKSVLNKNGSDPESLFSNQLIAAGEDVFLYTAGGKTGTGEVCAQVMLMPLDE